MTMPNKRLDEPAAVATVFLLEQRKGLWYCVIEEHENCHGMTHESCKISERAISDTGYTTREEAENTFKGWIAETFPEN